MAGTSFDTLGMPDLPERSYASVSETVQHSIYGGFAAPAAVLGGLLFLARRNIKAEQAEEKNNKKNDKGEAS